MATEMGIAYDVFAFLAEQSLSPFVSCYAEKLAGMLAESLPEGTDDQKKWLRAYCPGCGREPLISRLETEIGRRWLFCSFCHTEWLYKRVTCPFCENDNQDSLRYFFIEDDKSHRVDVCDKCKRYIKTVDPRETYRGLNPYVEHLSTLALDIVAEKEGYRQSGTMLA